MKTTFGWLNGGNGTNSSGFSGLPGDRRGESGSSGQIGEFAYWWSSTNIGDRSLGRYLKSDFEWLFPYEALNQNGFSVRCIQDSEE